jgi:hypothetical protein
MTAARTRKKRRKQTMTPSLWKWAELMPKAHTRPVNRHNANKM